jgi:RNA polymerase sigma-70 factor, ECF subfamily
MVIKMTKEEFQKRVIPIGEKMYRIAFRILGNSESAKDIVQEVFLKLWEKRDELNRLSSIDAFAFTILKNKCLDKLRMLKPTVQIDILTLKSYSQEEEFEMSEGISEIMKAMKHLPENQQLIMQLRDIDCCTFEDIALAMDISVNNVRVQLSMARKKVKERLMEVYNYGIPRN